VYSHIQPVNFVAPASGTAVVMFHGTCCFDTNPYVEGEPKSGTSEDPSTWLWLGIGTDFELPSDRAMIEMPNFPEKSLHYCMPTSATRSFQVPAGAKRLWVNAKTNGAKGGGCAGYSTVFFAEKQLEVPGAEAR